MWHERRWTVPANEEIVNEDAVLPERTQSEPPRLSGLLYALYADARVVLVLRVWLWWRCVGCWCRCVEYLEVQSTEEARLAQIHVYWRLATRRVSAAATQSSHHTVLVVRALLVRVVRIVRMG